MAEVSRRRRCPWAERYAEGGDPCAERYWQLVATVHGWPFDPTIAPAYRWLADALRPHRYAPRLPGLVDPARLAAAVAA